jgi:hypothetical protein
MREWIPYSILPGISDDFRSLAPFNHQHCPGICHKKTNQIADLRIRGMNSASLEAND